MNIELLFPTPVASVDNTSYLETEHDELLNLEYELTNGFEQTVNTRVLDSHATQLRSWIQQQIDQFSLNALATDHKLKITQSWCLKHHNQQQHVFAHSHANSIISGAYYVCADDTSEDIRFHKDMPTTSPNIKWETDKDLLKQQPWMWDWHSIKSQTGRLILFPSYVFHSVNGFLENPGTRCVLSFNTWFDGPIGSEQKLTRLGALQ